MGAQNELAIHTVYRLYDAEDQLLYVGMTDNVTKRFGQHARVQPWWGEVTRHAVEEFPDYCSARLAERDAIRAEKPRHNIVFNELVAAELATERSWDDPLLAISLRVTGAADRLHEKCRTERTAFNPGGVYQYTAPCRRCLAVAVEAVAGADAIAGHYDETVPLVDAAVTHASWTSHMKMATELKGLVSLPDPCTCRDCVAEAS